jgi:hypothetical protein
MRGRFDAGHLSRPRRQTRRACPRPRQRRGTSSSTAPLHRPGRGPPTSCGRGRAQSGPSPHLQAVPWRAGSARRVIGRGVEGIERNRGAVCDLIRSASPKAWAYFLTTWIHSETSRPSGVRRTGHPECAEWGRIEGLYVMIRSLGLFPDQDPRIRPFRNESAIHIRGVRRTLQSSAAGDVQPPPGRHKAVAGTSRRRLASEVVRDVRPRHRGEVERVDVV